MRRRSKERSAAQFISSPGSSNGLSTRSAAKFISSPGLSNGLSTTQSADGIEEVKETQEEKDQLWEVVGGGDKGGIMVRKGRELTSEQFEERLANGALVKEVDLRVDRLKFQRLTGSGPDFGWVSISLKSTALMMKTDRQPSEAEAAAREKELSHRTYLALMKTSDAIAPGAALQVGNDAFAAMNILMHAYPEERPILLLARGILLWRWSIIGKALAHLKLAEEQNAEGAQFAVLALYLCLSKWREAKRRAKALGCEDVLAAIDSWEKVASSCDMFQPPFPAAEMVVEPTEVVKGVHLTDVRVPFSDDTNESGFLGVRFLIRMSPLGFARTKRPLLLIFHREDEDVNAYHPDNFGPSKAVGANTVIASYRGFGFSTGLPSQSHLHDDADLICDSLPQLFQDLKYPWPWPGKLTLFGSSLGSRVACYLACTRPQMFDGGVVLETAWCGSHAPNAKPPPEPEQGGFFREKFEQCIWNTDLVKEAEQLGIVSRALMKQAWPEHVDRFCYAMGSEDLISGLGESNLLILHSEREMAVHPDNARRLCDAAESTSRQVVFVKGMDASTMRDEVDYNDALRTFLNRNWDSL